jgi:hypothetical protein
MALGIAAAVRIDKTVRAVERNAASKIAAEGALRLAPRDRAPGRTGSEITAHRRVLLLAEGLYANLDGLSPITLQAYRDRLDPRLQGSSRQLGPGVDRNSVSRASTRV